MDLLQGIQEVPGQTAGEKFKYINLTAKGIAENKCQNVEFPKQLQPLLKVEVAKLSHDSKVIVEALLSSDSLLCQRALQVPDLFTSDDSPLLNWEYFYNELLSRVSFTTRCKIIKKLESDLQSKDPKIAVEFYTGISKVYGEKQAHSLLLACSEDFIFEQIKSNNLNPSASYLEKLFEKYPAMVVKYLEMLYEKKEMYIINLGKFLPNLLDDHFDLLVRICQNSHRQWMSLGKRRTKIFLKKGKQVLIENPDKFLESLSLEIVSAKLSFEEFSTMMSKISKIGKSDFDYYHVSKKLKHFSTENKVSILLAAFKKRNNEDLCDHPDLIIPDLLSILPTELRIKVATKKLEKDSDWNLHNTSESWRVYLPFDTIVEDVKTQIAKRSDAFQRKDFILLLIKCCKINNDIDNLLEVLKYLQVRHKNEKFCFWSSILTSLRYKFTLSQLPQKIWDVLIEILQRLELDSSYNFTAVHSWYLNEGVQFKFLNNLDPDEYLRYYLKLMVKDVRGEYNFFDRLDLQRACLDKCMDLVVEALILYDEQVEEKKFYTVVDDLYNAMLRYNEMAESTPEGPPILKLEDHPSLVEFSEKYVTKDSYTFIICEYVYKYNRELHDKWYPNAKHPPITTTLMEDLKTLKKDYHQICSKWDECTDKIMDEIEYKQTKIFVKELRWYQDLPIKLADHCLPLVNDPDKYKSLLILGILYDSEKYQKLIERLLPETLTVDPTNETSVNHKKQAVFYIKGMKVTNLPLPLSFFKQFFTSDYLPVCTEALEQTASRTPIPTLINFVKSSLNDRVAVVKRLITLISQVPIEDRFSIYKTILHSNTHSSIHGYIMLKTLQLFRLYPSEEAWDFLIECINKKLIEDESMLKELANLNGIHDKYVESYVKRMMQIFEKIEIVGCPDLSETLISSIMNQMVKEKFSQILSVEFQLQLIKDHILECKFNNKPELYHYFIFSVFLHDKTQQKINLFLDMLNDYIKTYFAKPLIKKGNVSYPANKIVRNIILHFVSLSLNNLLKVDEVAILDRLLGLFDGLIVPYQDMKSYLCLKWAKMYSSLRDPKQFGIQFGRNLDDWLRSFGPAYLSKMVEIVKSFWSEYRINKSQHQERLWEFVDGLLEVKTENCYLTTIMIWVELKDCPRKKEVAAMLLKTEFPTVQIFVNDSLYAPDD